MLLYSYYYTTHTYTKMSRISFPSVTEYLSSVAIDPNHQGFLSDDCCEILVAQFGVVAIVPGVSGVDSLAGLEAGVVSGTALAVTLDLPHVGCIRERRGFLLLL
jgi:hypothetical protein